MLAREFAESVRRSVWSRASYAWNGAGSHCGSTSRWRGGLQGTCSGHSNMLSGEPSSQPCKVLIGPRGGCSPLDMLPKVLFSHCGDEESDLHFVWQCSRHQEASAAKVVRDSNHLIQEAVAGAGQRA